MTQNRPEVARPDAGPILAGVELSLRRLLAGRSDRGTLIEGAPKTGKTTLLERTAVVGWALGYEIVWVRAASEQLDATILEKMAGAELRFAGDRQMAETTATDSQRTSGDLVETIERVGAFARSVGRGVLILVDDADELTLDDLGRLISALHRATQLNLPVLLVATGRPGLAARAAEARSYAERMFHVVRPSLPTDASTNA